MTAPLPKDPAVQVLEHELALERQRVERQQRTIDALATSLKRVGPAVRLVAIGPAPDEAARAPAPPLSHALAPALGWPAIPLPKTPLPAPPGLAAQSLAGGKARTIAFAVFGLEGEALENAIRSVADRQRQAMDFVPVFLTDTPDLTPFRRRGYVAEYFGKSASSAGDDGPSLYRIAVILQKWSCQTLTNLSPLKCAARLELAQLKSMIVGIVDSRRFIEHSSQPTTQAVDSKPKAPKKREFRQVTHALGRLQLGFEDQGLIDLDGYVYGPNDSELRCEAAMVAASWHLNKANAAKAVEYLNLIRACSPERSKAADFNVLLAEALLELGQASKAASLCATAWDGNRSPNLALAMANALATKASDSRTGAHDDLRLRWINRSLASTGTAISKRSRDDSLTLENLQVRDLLRTGPDTPLISVLMPAHNAEATISASIESVLQQTWSNLELIVVDDGSTDSTSALVHAAFHRDPRVRLVVNSKNKGTGYSRSAALSQARGEFVTGQDADDWGHPKKIETQVAHLRATPSCVGNMSAYTRTTADLVFRRAGRQGAFIGPNMSSLMFRREPILERVGYWDNVRFEEDWEYVQRIESIFGASAVARLKTGPLLFGRTHEASQTSSTLTGYQGYKFGARKEYNEAARHWIGRFRTESSRLRLGFPLKRRPFPVPRILTSSSPKPQTFDVILASDFRMLGGNTNSCVEEIKAQKEAGLSTGLIHIPRYHHDPTRPVESSVRDLVDGTSVRMVTYGETARADLAIFRWPPALETRASLLPEVRANHLRIVMNQGPLRRRNSVDLMYDVGAVDRNAHAMFGVRGVWAPIGPEARETLRPYEGVLDVAAEDWVNVLSLREWPLRSARPRNAIPRVGRHARDHPDKWPERADQLLSAYPSVSGLAVAVMGGAEVPRTLLGSLPENWEVLKFNELSPQEFLRTLDVFVYYPHSEWIEAFGRVIFEAMAIGVPVLVPPVFRRTFGDAATYAPVSEVRNALDMLLNDQSTYEKQVALGRHFVEEKFGHEVHIRRLSALIAGPKPAIKYPNRLQRALVNEAERIT